MLEQGVRIVVNHVEDYHIASQDAIGRKRKPQPIGSSEAEARVSSPGVER